MKTLICTTETLHHAWYCQQLVKHIPDLHVVIEHYPQDKPLFGEQYDREKEIFFSGEDARVVDFVECFQVTSINSKNFISLLEDLQPDVIVTFGTGYIKAPTLALFPEQAWNLHGGDTRKYRGLDTHYWAMYHNDFRLVTTLHFLTTTLDTGDIILQGQLDLQSVTNFADLQYQNTRICVELSVIALQTFRDFSKVPKVQLDCLGQYYGPIPADCKKKAEKNYIKFKESQLSVAT